MKSIKKPTTDKLHKILHSMFHEKGEVVSISFVWGFSYIAELLNVSCPILHKKN